MNIEIVPNMNGGVEEENETRPHHHHHDHEGGGTTTAVIENIDSINNNNNNSTNNNEQDDEGIISTAISDDETSATSIASTLSDGISRRRRPRSVSLHNNITPRISDSDNDNSDANHHRPSSIPRLRPRSNPRTRTPMRHESPLLVISPVFGGGHHAATEAGRMRANEHHVDGIAIRDSNSEGSAVQLDNVDESSSNTDNERLIRNIFHTRRNHRARRLRAGSISIPEEDSMVADVAVVDEGGITIIENTTLATAASNNSNTASNQANNSNGGTAPPPAEATTTNNNTTTRRTAGRFFTQAVATNSTTSSSTRRRRNNNQSNQPNTTQQRTLSTKQNPSHRKIRRWKNDAFIGTPSEHVHTMLVTREGTLDDSKGGRGWNEFPYMPNYPREYKSEFGRLSMDRTRGGEVVRQRFVRGEVASVDFALKKNGSDDVMGQEEEEWGEEMVMQRRIVAKCRQLGMSPKIMNEKNNDEWGKVLYDKLGSRIQSILSRSCSISGNNDEATVTNASRIVSTFETYLVSLALQSKKIDIDDNGSSGVMGFPPLQSQYVYDVFDEILASPPRIVIREKRSSSNSCKQRIDKAAASIAAAAATTTTKAALDMNKCGVLIPTIHFYFPTEDQDGSSRRSSAFHRILLYAVCQFHGLETSSSVVLEKNLKQDNVRKRGKQQQHVKGSVKVVTIQGGLLLAPSMKLLDFVCT